MWVSARLLIFYSVMCELAVRVIAFGNPLLRHDDETVKLE